MTEQEWLTTTNLHDMLNYFNSNQFLQNTKIQIAYHVRCCKLRTFAETIEPMFKSKSYDEYTTVSDWTGLLLDYIQPDITLHINDSKQQADIFRDIIGNHFRPITIDQNWLTPEVMLLAQSIYDERETKKCDDCWDGRMLAPLRSGKDFVDCIFCHGVGRIKTGRLYNSQLILLANALEKAGCPVEIELKTECTDCAGTRRVAAPRGDIARWWPCDNGMDGMVTEYIVNPILDHLRSPGIHWYGCHIIDLIIGARK